MDQNSSFNINNDIKCVINDIIKNSSITFLELSETATLDCILDMCKETLSQIYKLDEITLKLISKYCETELNRLKSLDEIVYSSLVNREDHTRELTKQEKQKIIKQIKYLKEQPQYQQKSPEWFAHRLTMVTASNLSAAIGKSKYKSNYNNLIIRKCGIKMKYISSDATRHGVKYEDVAIMLYEKKNNVCVEEYGCIRHKTIPYLGASPDGICGIKSKNQQIIGRMLEIKCPYSRKITGIPPVGYAIQVQGQLEVCNLEYCDFLECKISEYDNKDCYFNDIETEDKGSVIEVYNISKKNPEFFYSKININKEEYDIWEENIIDKIWDDPNLDYKNTVFWKLEKYSCVLLKRNREWFNKILPDITNFWNIVQKYKKTGCDELLKKKKKKTYEIPTFGFYDGDNLDTTNENTTSNDKIIIKKKKKKKKKKKDNNGPPKEIKLNI
tara:strand:+ start:3715 stop:5040 length:1326 start_codon:yes stop_codon:yes gene_type:complete